MNGQTKSVAVIILALAVCFVGSSGCVENVSARVDRKSVQATPDRPVSTEVETVSIPADPNLPTVVVVVEPFVMAASGVTAGPKNGVPILNPGEKTGPGVAAQLVTSLRKVGNLVIIDYDTYQRNPDKIAGNLKAGELGPFVIKGVVTEFGETPDSSVKGESTGPNVPAMFIPIVGGLVSYGIGTKAESESKHIGMVGLDIQIISPATGRLITSFTSEGSFTSVSVTKSRTQWGGTRSNTESASSAIGQAQRIALNKAVIQIHSALISQ